MPDTEWCKESYQKSITSRAWNCTPYDAGWDESQKYGKDIPLSVELKAIFEEEMALGSVPKWAAEIVHRMIGPLPMCGHYAFPRPLLQICEAIRREKCPEFVCGCYTADSERKVLMSYYIYCLDAWLKSAPLETATAELAMRDSLSKDWSKIVAAIYKSLGNRSELKVLLLRRLVHRLRWWIKTLTWFDDKRDRHMLDVYSGDVRGDEENWGAYGNSPFGDPYFAELELAETKELAEQIRQSVPNGEKTLQRIESTGLCAPKVFRYLEKLILEIGSIGSEGTPSTDTNILQCKDTYPNTASCQRWHSSLLASLTGWIEGNPQALIDLGDITPDKHWLVKILRHKLKLYEKHCSFGNLVGAKPSGKSGSKAI